jgi:hypothetical protein
MMTDLDGAREALAAAICPAPDDSATAHATCIERADRLLAALSSAGYAVVPAKAHIHMEYRVVWPGGDVDAAYGIDDARNLVEGADEPGGRIEEREIAEHRSVGPWVPVSGEGRDD